MHSTRKEWRDTTDSNKVRTDKVGKHCESSLYTECNLYLIEIMLAKGDRICLSSLNIAVCQRKRKYVFVSRTH